MTDERESTEMICEVCGGSYAAEDMEWRPKAGGWACPDCVHEGNSCGCGDD